MTIKYDGSISKLTPLATQSSSKKDWKDVWRFQFGVEYSLNEMVDLRASYIYDQSPIPDEHVDYILPANNRHIFGLGTGFKLDKWTIDLSYNYLMYEDRDVDGRTSDHVYDGKFKDGNAHLVGVSVGYSF
ncbi:MAG: long-chain fatty acid transport protein [Desulfonauticus sp.]|nr:long-chain fatty acid transport protein [Desulfonauticus sp.]